MFFTLKYTLIITIIMVMIMMLTGLIAYAQEADLGEGASGGSSAPPTPQLSAPQGEFANDLIIPADGNEPSRIEDASGKIAIEGKIIQLERKVDQLIYLNAILLLFIVVTAGSFGIVKIRKKLL